MNRCGRDKLFYSVFVGLLPDIFTAGSAADLTRLTPAADVAKFR